MSGIMKVFLLLAVMVCMAKAQLSHTSGKQCLCQRVRNGIRSRNTVKEVQVYPATIFCDKVEIVVTLNSGLRYCLNPNLKAVQKLMAFIIKRQSSSTTRPTELMSTTNTARI
ncbi:C-X-C motif chemokine 10 [Pseudoliparis swirei]|uniref:C-X-C motif chemokine 10 n=1 Tax=Pseudoliparis swirei TaxID=2059687 RepID=UPI0024BDA196|nr:C-X-C motif chemokine 10 [Pseudoliparis swirei]